MPNRKAVSSERSSSSFATIEAVLAITIPRRACQLCSSVGKFLASPPMPAVTAALSTVPIVGRTPNTRTASCTVATSREMPLLDALAAFKTTAVALASSEIAWHSSSTGTLFVSIS